MLTDVNYCLIVIDLSYVTVWLMWIKNKWNEMKPKHFALPVLHYTLQWFITYNHQTKYFKKPLCSLSWHDTVQQFINYSHEMRTLSQSLYRAYFSMSWYCDSLLIAPKPTHIAQSCCYFFLSKCALPKVAHSSQIHHYSTFQDPYTEYPPPTISDDRINEK
jgi:hypothetical protein